MTPEELKAKELVERFKRYAYMDWHEVRGFDKEEQEMNAINSAILHIQLVLEDMEAEDKEHGDCHNLNSPRFRRYENRLSILKSMKG